MNLGELLSRIKEVEPYTKEDVETGPYETLNARRGRKNQAIGELATLRQAYTREFLQTAVFVVVVGDKQQEFNAMAVDSFKSFSADPEEYFAKLVDKIPPALYLGRESVSNIFDILGRHIEDSAPDLGIVGYPQLVFRQEYQRSLHNREEFQSLVKQAVVNQIGGEIVGIQAAVSLTDSAISKSFSGKQVPVLLPTTDDRFGYKLAVDLNRVSTRVFIVQAGEVKTAPSIPMDAVLAEVTKEELRKVFKTIGSSLRK